jgi:hypothetical protein
MINFDNRFESTNKCIEVLKLPVSIFQNSDPTNINYLEYAYLKRNLACELEMGLKIISKLFSERYTKNEINCERELSLLKEFCNNHIKPKCSQSTIINFLHEVRMVDYKTIESVLDEAEVFVESLAFRKGIAVQSFEKNLGLDQVKEDLGRKFILFKETLLKI